MMFRGGMGMGQNGRGLRVEPTDEWEQIELLCGWPEQRDYEFIRPLVLFVGPASERAEATGAASERTLQRRVARFKAEGMESLFGSEPARRKRLPDSMRRLIVDLKAEYLGFNANEIVNACYVRFGRSPARKTVKRVLAEEPTPLRFVRCLQPYHEMEESAERRRAVVALHAEGWSAKAIAGYLRVHTPSSTRFAHNDEPITLAGRVYLFFGYVDLHRRSHLADLGERADGREVVPMRPVETLLIVVALVYGVITRVRSVQALKELDLQPCGDDALRQEKLQWRGVPTGYLRAHGLELVLHHLFG